METEKKSKKQPVSRVNLIVKNEFIGPSGSIHKAGDVLTLSEGQMKAEEAKGKKIIEVKGQKPIEVWKSAYLNHCVRG